MGQFTKWDVMALGLAFLTAVALLVTVWVDRGEPAEQHQGNTQLYQHEKNPSNGTIDYNAINLALAKEELALAERDLWAQQVMAVGTLALFGLTLFSIIASIWFSNASLKASTKAAKATKRSVDAYIAAERGRMIDVRVAIHEDRKSFGFDLQNIGRSTVVLRYIAFHIQPRPLDLTEEPVRRQIVPRSIVNQPIKVNEGFGFLSNDKHPREPIPRECFDTSGNFRGCLIQFEIGYSTLDKSYVRHASWLLLVNVVTGDGTVVPDGSARYPNEAHHYDEIDGLGDLVAGEGTV